MFLQSLVVLENDSIWLLNCGTYVGYECTVVNFVYFIQKISEFKPKPFAVLFSIDIVVSEIKSNQIFSETTMSIVNKMANGSSFRLNSRDNHCKVIIKNLERKVHPNASS